jgi:hypothetical protein
LKNEKNKECLLAAGFSENPGKGELHDGYHGDPNRSHRFWIYRPDQRLPTPRWDTHDNPPVNFCTNHHKVNDNTYECRGHNLAKP